MKKVLNNLKKTKYIIITIVLIAIIGLVITLNNAGVITKLGNVIRRNIFALDEGNIETTSYYTIGAINGNYLTCQISFENAIGIEKITANGVEIDGKGKTKIGVDRILQEGEELQFNVKIVGKEQEELHTIVATKEEIKMQEANFKLDGNNLVETIEIEYPNKENLINYYSIDNGKSWEEYTGPIEIVLATNEGQTEEIKVIAKSDCKEGKTIRKGKLKEYIANGNGLICKVGYLIESTGYYNINVNGEEYSIHAYVYDNDITFSNDQIFGDENDVGSASDNAKNMVIVKVNGDLTINSGVTLTAYGTEYGGPKGMVVYATGTITNNGTISMTARGAKAEGKNVYLWGNADITNGKYETVPAAGAAGGASIMKNDYVDAKGTIGNIGEKGNKRQTGGGGSGAVVNHYSYSATSGAGAQGTSYSGGTGGGGAMLSIAEAGHENGGVGGLRNSFEPSWMDSKLWRRCGKSRR